MFLLLFFCFCFSSSSFFISFLLEGASSAKKITKRAVRPNNLKIGESKFLMLSMFVLYSTEGDNSNKSCFGRKTS